MVVSEGRISIWVGSEFRADRNRLEVEKFVEKLTEIKSGIVEVQVTLRTLSPRVDN